MFQNKAQIAENGWSFSRYATQCWGTWGPTFGRAGTRSSVVLRLLARTGPLPTRRALRPTPSQFAESAIIMLREHKALLILRCGKETTEYSNERSSQPLVSNRLSWKPGFTAHAILLGGCCCFLGDNIIKYIQDNCGVWYQVLAVHHEAGGAGDPEDSHILRIAA